MPTPQPRPTHLPGIPNKPRELPNIELKRGDRLSTRRRRDQYINWTEPPIPGFAFRKWNTTRGCRFSIHIDIRGRFQGLAPAAVLEKKLETREPERRCRAPPCTFSHSALQQQNGGDMRFPATHTGENQWGLAPGATETQPSRRSRARCLANPASRAAPRTQAKRAAALVRTAN